jgi:hypothetical protein
MSLDDNASGSRNIPEMTGPSLFVRSVFGQIGGLTRSLLSNVGKFAGNGCINLFRTKEEGKPYQTRDHPRWNDQGLRSDGGAAALIRQHWLCVHSRPGVFARGLVIRQQRLPWRIEFRHRRWGGGFFVQ